MINTIGAAWGSSSQLFTDLSARKAGRQAAASVGPTKVPIMGPNGLHFSGDWTGQSVYVEYADGSTDEDPIVRITGDSLSGKYDKIVHINDIDPQNATYPEMCALMSYQRAIGAYKGPVSGGFLPVPLDVDPGDYSKPQNFLDKIQGSVSHNRRYRNHAMADIGSALLAFYRDLAPRPAAADSQAALASRKHYAAHQQMVDEAARAFGAL